MDLGFEEFTKHMFNTPNPPHTLQESEDVQPEEEVNVGSTISLLVSKYLAELSDLVLLFFIGYLVIAVLRKARLKDFPLIFNVLSLFLASLCNITL